MLDSQATSAAIYKQLFTDAEWDAISSAMKDYSDYGDEESAIADSIDCLLYTSPSPRDQRGSRMPSSA